MASVTNRAAGVGSRIVDALLEASVVGGHTTIGFTLRRRLQNWGPAVDRDLTGRTYVVTGATSGIGRSTALQLAGAGATVRSASRSTDRAEEAQAYLRAASGNDDVRIDTVDLARPALAELWASRLIDEHHRLDGLLHVAGAYFDTHTLTDDGIEANAAVYLVGPFVLTRSLAPLLQAGDDARVVTASSSGAYTARLSVAALEPDPDDYRALRAYANSKRAQLGLTHLWARKLGPEVAVHAMTPGWSDTPLLRDGLPRFRRFFLPVLRSADQGADTLAWLASEPGDRLGTDGLWRDRQRRFEHRLPHTLKSDDLDDLWDWCERQSRATPGTTASPGDG